MKVEALQRRIDEINAKIGPKPEFLVDCPHGSAITDRQKYVGYIGSLRWSLRNTIEPTSANFSRLVAEQRQQLGEMKKFSAIAEARLEELKFSSMRLQMAVNGDDIWRFDETVKSLRWWLETDKEKIRSQEKEVAKLEKLKSENDRKANDAKVEISRLESELKAYDRRHSAELAAEREMVLALQTDPDDRDEDNDAAA